MAENLRTTKYSDGTDIPYITDNIAWTTAGSAYCWYNNDINNKMSYGALYNKYAVDSTTNGNKNVCPTGWHVASDAQWNALSNYLGGNSISGGKLKETGTTHWSSPNTGATDEKGFTALPGGCRMPNDGTFHDIGNAGNWWRILCLDNGGGVGYHVIVALNTIIDSYPGGSEYNWGMSVRCIKD